MSKNILYIAKPIPSQLLLESKLKFVLPDILKIGVTTDDLHKRERELMGVNSPFKIAMIMAWTLPNAEVVEKELHRQRDESRLDGEFFSDAKGTLIERIATFIKTYHPDAKLIELGETTDSIAANEAERKEAHARIRDELIPALEKLGLLFFVNKKGRGGYTEVGDYKLYVGLRTQDRYTMGINRRTGCKKSPEDAMKDFSLHSGKDDYSGARIGQIGLKSLADIIEQIATYKASLKP
jgi:hypothetical protein